MAFDTLRYARRLKEVGVPEPQADVQAELMAEAFGFYADNLLTRDHFTEVLNARFAEQEARLEQRLGAMDSKFERRLDAMDSKFEKRHASLDSKFEKRFGKQDTVNRLHTWMLGLITVAVVIPQLQGWLG
jgi:hypothetical protein